MQIRKMSRLMTALIVGLTLVEFFVFIYSSILTSAARLYSENAHNAIEATYLYSEGIDRSIVELRAWIVTGDVEHKLELNEETKQARGMQQALDTLRRSSLESGERAELESAKAWADTLVDLEDQAITRYARGDVTGAKEIAFGPAFDRQYANTLASLRKTRAMVQTRLEAEREVYEHSITISHIMATIVSLANVATILVALFVFIGRNVVNPVTKLTDSMERLKNGELAVRFDIAPDRNEIGSLATALESFREERDEAELKQWVKNGVEEIIDRLRRAEGLASFTRVLLDSLAHITGAGAGIFYYFNNQTGKFFPAGTWGVAEGEISATDQDSFGFVQEAVYSSRYVVIDNVPPSYLRIRSGLGEARPACIVVIPINANTIPLACLELALFSQPDSRLEALIRELPNAIAPHLQILQRNLRTQELLAETEKQAERLQEQTRQLRDINNEQQAIFDAATTGIVLLQNNIILRCNKRLEDIFGYQPASLVGKPIRLWFQDEEAWKRLNEESADAFRHNSIFVRELRLIRQDGSLFWARIRTRVLDQIPGGYRLVSIVEDITDERDTRDALKTAKDEAEEAARAKSNFLANMSHEIRTPLNAIIGMSHLTLNGDLRPKQREYLSRIEASGHHLLGIINDILDFSKIEAGKFNIEAVPFSLEELLSSVSGMLNERSAEKGLELIFEIEPDVPARLVGDQLRLEQILLNYGANAIKFTERGEVKITVKVAERALDSVFLRFAVVDTGIGLSEDAQKKLFSSFQQADMSTTRKYGGTGLGLAISKQLATLMGGEVGLESELGKGSEFWFTARLGIDETGIAEQPPDSGLKGHRMLVVDDNEHARVAIRDMLASMSFDVDMAASGESAIEAVHEAVRQQRPFRLIYMDWKMPDMDGIEAATRIHGEPSGAETSIVLLTGFDTSGIQANLDEARIEKVLIKPVTPSMLFDTSIAVLTGADPKREMPESPVKFEKAADIHGELAGGRALLVEDNELNQIVASDLLGDLHMLVDIAENGAVAIEMTKNRRYEVILMDMQMPVMDGLTATRIMREMPSLDATPILAMTANAMKSEHDACFAAGMNDIILKPINPEQMRSILIRNIRMPEPVPGDSDGIPPIHGLDTAAGLANSGGSEGRYRQLLRNACSQYRSLPEILKDGAAVDSDSSLAKTVHALRRTLETLGARDLAAEADEIENALWDNAGASMGDRLAAFAIALQLLLAEAEAAVGTEKN